MRDHSDRDLRVLLVEDDLLTREVLAAALVGTGFEVHAEADGTHVERAAAAFRPDIALIDMRLGDGVDGITVARRSKGSDDFPLLFITSASSTEDVLAAYDVGGDDYIIKPFVMTELVLGCGRFSAGSGARSGPLSSWVISASTPMITA